MKKFNYGIIPLVFISLSIYVSCLSDFSDASDLNQDPDPNIALVERVCNDSLDNEEDGLTDCSDPDCYADSACVSNAENTIERCTDEIDNDGNGAADCKDVGCKYFPTCLETNCTDSIDNDQNGYVDCDDYSCFSSPICQSNSENSVATCTDGVDNDDDGATDCDDKGCEGVSICLPEHSCIDNKDNDGDGFVDCYDSDCDLSPECAEKECSDELDNDDNGLTDCDDPACEYKPECAPELNCTDRVDNDLDGFTDCDDGNCRYQPECQRPTENTVQQCSDGLDNDLDNNFDCDDTDCMILAICQEDNQLTCTDGDDNDGDGKTDCADDGCSHLSACQENTTANCADGDDNDVDGFIDCADPDCEYTTACMADGENTAALCQDNVNNDAPTAANNPWEDNLIDCEDSQCAEFLFCKYPPQDTMFVIDHKETDLATDVYYATQNPWGGTWVKAPGDTRDNGQRTSGCHEGSTCRTVNFNTAGWEMLYFIFMKDPNGSLAVGSPARDTVDMSAFVGDDLVFMLKVSAPLDLQIKLEYRNPGDASEIDLSPALGYDKYSTDWQEIRIVLNDWSSQGKMTAMMLPFSIMKFSGTGTVWIDDIRYELPPAL